WAQNSAQDSDCMIWTRVSTCPRMLLSASSPSTVLPLNVLLESSPQYCHTLFFCPFQWWEPNPLEAHLLLAILHNAAIVFVQLFLVVSVIRFEQGDRIGS